MATFIPVPIGPDTSLYINLDLVRSIKPMENGGSKLLVDADIQYR